MAGNNSFSATLYGEASSYDGKNGGWLVANQYPGPVYESFPVVGTRVIGISPAQTLTSGASTITVNSIIEILPTGLATQGWTKQYFCDATVATLQTARD